MQKLKKINLNLEKDVIAFLNEDSMSEMKGGGWTSGCTDGCSPAQSWGPCTNANCTYDCGSNQLCQDQGYNTIGGEI